MRDKHNLPVNQDAQLNKYELLKIFGVIIGFVLAGIFGMVFGGTL
jgi:hypothetical protein